jgi:hypothetical protein
VWTTCLDFCWQHGGEGLVDAHLASSLSLGRRKVWLKLPAQHVFCQGFRLIFFCLHLLHCTALNQGKQESNRANLEREIWGLTNKSCSSSNGGILHATGFMGCHDYLAARAHGGNMSSIARNHNMHAIQIRVKIKAWKEDKCWFTRTWFDPKCK